MLFFYKQRLGDTFNGLVHREQDFEKVLFSIWRRGEKYRISFYKKKE
jgi:hypothetical protein